MTSFYERPILNSPYRAPELHHPLDDNGQPLEGAPRPGRRPSRLIVPVPASRKKAAAAQASLELETYTDHALINVIHDGTTLVVPRPNFCPIKAVETIIP